VIARWPRLTSAGGNGKQRLTMSPWLGLKGRTSTFAAVQLIWVKSCYEPKADIASCALYSSG